MADLIQVEMEIPAALLRKFERLPGVMAQAQRVSTQDVLKQAKQEARRVVPVDEGDLQQSIRFKTFIAALEVVGILLAGAFKGRNKYVFYHWFVHDGTSKMKAVRFMSHAFRVVRQQFIRSTRETADKVIKDFNR